ncbi:hypothetical protein [Lacimonas salitolerans]
MPHDAQTRPDLPVYVVMDSNVLIAEDLCGSLKAAGPCRVINVPTPSELVEMLEHEPVVSAAFLEIRYDHLLQEGLDQVLLARGAKIILTMGEDDECRVQKHGWTMLLRPFTEEMIRSALQPSAQGA